jgi:predicted RNA binding protein YcfA (HicA-like mRNA interferase family)
MKKIPRNVDASSLIKALRILEYEVTRQVGSHIRITTFLNGEHHTTIPNHNPIKIGTLSSILSGIAIHFNLTKQELLDKIF